MHAIINLPMAKYIKSLVATTCLSIAGAGICLGIYPFRERSIPEHLKHYDLNKDKRLDREECFNIAAALVDKNWDTKIDSQEDDIGNQLVSDLWGAWGMNNFRSALALKQALKEIQAGEKTKEDWETAVNSYQD